MHQIDLFNQNVLLGDDAPQPPQMVRGPSTIVSRNPKAMLGEEIASMVAPMML